MTSGQQFLALTKQAAGGDREAARKLIEGGWWPANWDADDEGNQNRVIAGSVAIWKDQKTDA